MSFSDVVVLLARQRSGTNALRSVLRSHPDVFCFGEVFNLPDRWSEDAVERESNYFTFLEEYGRGDVTKLFPDRTGHIFSDYFEYLRTFSDRPLMLVDIKYNQMQFFQPVWGDNFLRPHLFTLMRDHQMRILRLTRKNYLRSALSMLKADRSGRHTVDRGRAVSDESLWLNPDPAAPLLKALGPRPSALPDKAIRAPFGNLLSELTKYRIEDQAVDRSLDDHKDVLSLDYADLFPQLDGVPAPQALAEVARWLGISEDFPGTPEYRKQSVLPLHEALSNFEELADVLKRTEFAYCLEDEPAYRSAASGRGPRS